MESYIDCKKKLYNTILEFLEESNELSQQNFGHFCENMTKYHFEGNQEEMSQFLLIIKSLMDHHHRDKNFIQRINAILEHYKEQIKQTLSNDALFHIFENNKLIVLFLLQNDIIKITDSIYSDMLNKIETNGNRYCHFFYPELVQYKGEEEMKSIKEEILSTNPTAFEEFENKRQEGENDSYICSLIRKDSIDEFIPYINRYSISMNSVIKPSIFETNPFLIENKNTTLIEYSSFFGSIQIFKYLFLNKVELTPSLWYYTIHSRNAELINFLESNKVNPPKFMINNKSRRKVKEENYGYLLCLTESIKCHHNEFTEYIENNLMSKFELEKLEAKKEIVSNSIKYHNYSYFHVDLIKEVGFFYLHLYNYKKLCELLLKEKEDKIKEKIIFIEIF